MSEEDAVKKKLKKAEKNTDVKNVFESRYYSYIKEKIDTDLLDKASKLFIGTHDFKNFTTNKIEEVESFVKTIFDVKVKSSKENQKICVSADGETSIELTNDFEVKIKKSEYYAEFIRIKSDEFYDILNSKLSQRRT